MKTNFFEQIAGLKLNGNLLLNIHHDETGLFTVSAVIKKANLNGLNNLPPMIWSGTTAELDEDFFSQLAQPLKATVGLVNNLENYQKELEKAKKNNTKSSADKESKTAIPETEDDQEDEPDLFSAPADDSQAKAEKKRLFDDGMDKAKQLAGQMKYAEALAQLPDPADHPEQAELIASKRKVIETGKEMYDKLANQFKD